MKERKLLKEQIIYSKTANPNWQNKIRKQVEASSFFKLIYKIYSQNKIEIKNQNVKKIYKYKIKQSVFFMLTINFTYMLSLVCMVLFRDSIINSGQYVKIMFLSTTVLVFLGFFFLPYKMIHYGLNLNRLDFNIRYGILTGLILSLLAVLLRHYLILAGKTEFAFNPIPEWEFYIYPISVFAQETMTKGFLQNYFVFLFDHTKKNLFIAIVLSSLIFGLMHLMYGFFIMFLTTLFSIALGFFYSRSRSLVGVYIIHFMTGTALFYFKY